jgi:hypothetical protein
MAEERLMQYRGLGRLELAGERPARCGGAERLPNVPVSVHAVRFSRKELVAAVEGEGSLL